MDGLLLLVAEMVRSHSRPGEVVHIEHLVAG
jgi:hypothetical protein